MTAKNYFLYAGCRTHLLRFHGERPYHVRVEIQVVVSLGASEFCSPLNVGAFWFTARDMFNPPIEKNVFESGIAYIYTVLKSFRQVKNYIMLSAPINYFSFKFQWTEIPILATLCAPWKKTLPLWRSRLCRGFFHTACLFTVRRLKWPSFHTDGVLLSYRRSLCQKVNWTHTSDNLTKRLRLTIASLKTIGIYVLSVMQCRCLDRACKLFDCL